MVVVGPWISIRFISFPLEYMWLTETSNVLVTSSSSGRSPVKWIKECFVRYPDHPTCMKGGKRNDRSRAKLTLCLIPFLPLSVRGVSSNKSLSFLSQFSICFSEHLIWHSLVQFSHSVISDFTTPWTAACQAYLSITNSHSMLKLMSIDMVMPSNHLILCRPLLLLPSIFPSIRVFASVSALHIRWPKDWSSASASVLPMNIRDWFPSGLTDLVSL